MNFNSSVNSAASKGIFRNGSILYTSESHNSMIDGSAPSAGFEADLSINGSSNRSNTNAMSGQKLTNFSQLWDYLMSFPEVREEFNRIKSLCEAEMAAQNATTAKSDEGKDEPKYEKEISKSSKNPNEICSVMPNAIKSLFKMELEWSNGRTEKVNVVEGVDAEELSKKISQKFKFNEIQRQNLCQFIREQLHHRSQKTRVWNSTTDSEVAKNIPPLSFNYCIYMCVCVFLVS